MKESTLQVLKKVEEKVACIFSCFSASHFKVDPKESNFLLTSNELVNLNLDELIIKNQEV